MSSTQMEQHQHEREREHEYAYEHEHERELRDARYIYRRTHPPMHDAQWHIPCCMSMHIHARGCTCMTRQRQQHEHEGTMQHPGKSEAIISVAHDQLTYIAAVWLHSFSTHTSVVSDFA